MKNPICVIIPNWNGADMIKSAITSVHQQSLACDIIVVDNGSRDESLKILRPLATQKQIILIEHQTNLGFTGGVNAGLSYALRHDYQAAALLNNDAIADKHWLAHLYERMQSNPHIAAVTGKILSMDGSHIDSTGDYLSVWGLPFPRGRGEPDSKIYDTQTRVLAASGGATLYRLDALRQVGLFDPDFFAYYEDVDLSLRLRLAGWEIVFEPKAFVLHAIGASSARVKGFTTLQTLKNLPWLLIKDVPGKLLWRMYPRFALAYGMFFGRAIIDGRGWWALRGFSKSIWLLPKKLGERHTIQKQRVSSVEDLNSLLLHDLPPNAANLRKLRSLWWKVRGKV